ncbi:hypothetical protein BDV11DRAFT_166882 [Aspergillus similis]
MSHINGSEPSQAQRETEGRWEERNVLCDQIKEIIAALNDIRSQLAEQNKYLDVLTETYVRKPAATHLVFAEELETGDWDEGSDWGDHVDFAHGEGLHARAMEENHEGNYGEDNYEGISGEENYEGNYGEENYEGNYGEKNYEEGNHEKEKGNYGGEESKQRDFVYDTETAPTREQREAIAAESMDDRQKQEHYSLESSVPSTVYLPLGLVISLFCMRFFNAKQSAHVSQTSFTTVFIILSLAAYIFATFTLWFLREEDWVKRVIGSWRLANASSSADANADADSIQADQDRGSRLPDLLRRRKALETS